MGYWNRVFRRAAQEAARDAKLDTWANAMITIGVQAFISFIIWVTLGYAWPSGTLSTRLLVIATPFFVFPLAMVVRFIAIPVKMAREDEATIKSLAAALDSRERKKAIKAIIGDHMRQGSELLSLHMRDRMDLAENWVTSTRDFINAAFGSG